MLNNDVLRRLRFLLNINDAKLRALLETVNCQVSQTQLESYLAREEEAHFALCSDEVLASLLDAMVIAKRGVDPNLTPRALEVPVSNNQVLKKLRVAFSLKDHDIVDLMASVDFKVSKSELNALFRKPGQSNYRECGDQFLRQFLKALTLSTRENLRA